MAYTTTSIPLCLTIYLTGQWLRFAKGAASGIYQGQDAFLGMVEAMVKKTERLAAGKSLRNMHYASAFAELCDTLGTISP